MAFIPIGVKVKKLVPNAQIPEYATIGSAGCDVFSLETVCLEPGASKAISTGLCFEIPDGYECQVRPRSGIASKYGITVLNSPGCVDSDYRGEVKVILVNHSKQSYVVNVGDKIAQLIFAPVMQVTFNEVHELIETGRSRGGFGSTGILADVK